MINSVVKLLDIQAAEEEAEGYINRPRTSKLNMAWGPNYYKEGYLEFGNGGATPGPISTPRKKPKMVQRDVRMRVRPANLCEIGSSACTYTDSPGGLNPSERGTPDLKARL